MEGVPAIPHREVPRGTSVRVAARASGNVAGANTFAIALAELREQESALGQDAGAFTKLQDEVDSAKSQVVRAQEARETAVRDAAEVKPEGNYNFGRKNEAQDRAATIWRRTLAVMLACFVLSILLVAWLASLTPEAEAVPAEADAEPEAEPEPEPDAVLVPAEEDSARSGRRSSRYREPKRDPDGITLGVRPT